MEDLAYIYLALNEEVERAQSSDSAPTPILSAWAPSLPGDRPHLTLDQTQETPTIQEPDMDYECHAYPSFYL